MNMHARRVRGWQLQAGNVMRRLWFVVLLCSLAFPRWAFANDIAPGGTLRAVYLGSNPAQAVQDRATGAIRGASADLARELGKRINVPVELKPAASPQAVIDAVSSGAADIGFVAYEPSRAGTVEFSQTYMLVQQSFLVLDGSPIRTVADIDRAGQVIAGVRNDSIALYLKRKLKQATLLEVENNPAGIQRLLTGKEIDAFGANRQRLTTLMGETPRSRLLPDSLFGVPQTIIVPKGRADVLTAVNSFIDDVRASGFLQNAIANSGVIGLQAAPGGSWQPSVPD
jgi:polar amino acid transport system substrate-binding protein